MLEGLEARSVGISKAETNKDFRMDSDFWTREPKRNPALDYAPIGSVLESAQYGISIEMNEDGIGVPIYRMNEIHNMLCDFDVSKSADIGPDDVKKFKLNDRDVLFNRTNSFEWVGRTGLFREQADINFVFASYLVRLVPNEQVILPEYLVAFLNCKYGIWDIRRRSRQSINQTNVNPEEVKEIEIPLLGDGLQRLIKQCFDHGAEGIQKSKRLMSTAESTLIKALGLDNWTPPTPLSYVRSSSDAFTSGRLDAEHFQVQYDDIEQKIKRNQHGHTTIGELAHDLMNGAEVREYQDKGVAYLRVGDLKNLDIDPNSVVRIDPVSAEKGLEKIPLRKGDVLVSRSGSLAVTAVVEPEWEDALISSHLIRLRIEDERIDPYFLALFLSSLPGKKQIHKWSNGGVQPEISQPSLSNILVPVVDANIQQEIRRNILLSREERQKAESLLDAAKRAVEITIEESEAAALAYLQGVI